VEFCVGLFDCLQGGTDHHDKTTPPTPDAAKRRALHACGSDPGRTPFISYSTIDASHLEHAGMAARPSSTGYCISPGLVANASHASSRRTARI
jgi:hypothetical protein